MVTEIVHFIMTTFILETLVINTPAFKISILYLITTPTFIYRQNYSMFWELTEICRNK